MMGFLEIHSLSPHLKVVSSLSNLANIDCLVNINEMRKKHEQLHVLTSKLGKKVKHAQGSRFDNHRQIVITKFIVASLMVY